MAVDETVEISKREYDKLKKSHAHLMFLFGLGVDNWEGYRYPADDEDEEDDDGC